MRAFLSRWRQPSQDPPTASYRPDIDGLRALAILSVVLYHADIRVVGGGFVGVDVFFVISGYLITAIIARETAEGRFTYARFYERRIRRIFPALFAMALATTVVAALLLIPSSFDQYGRSLAAVALFASNFFFVQDVGVTGYFHSVADSPLLIHTWSLAVEEQFYILLPPAMLALRHYAPRHMTGALALTTFLSFALSLWLVPTHPSEAFYLIPSRAWELLMGGLLAVAPFPSLAGRRLREATAGLGLALILVAILGFTDATPFPGASAALPCVGAWLLIYAGGQGPSLTRSLLSRRPAVALGKVSYSLYLWHWPIITVIKYMADRQLTTRTTVAALALSLLAAVLSYRFVETPFRRPSRPVTRPTLFATTTAALGLLVVVAGTIAAGGGLPQRFSPQLRDLIAQNLARTTDNTGNPACDNYQHTVATVTDLKTCPIGHAATNIFFWGDSHMEEMRPVVETLYHDDALQGRGAVFAIAPACAPSTSMDRTGLDLHCDQIAKVSLERATAQDIDTVVILYTGWRTSTDGDLCKVAGTTCAPLKKEAALATMSAELAGDIRLLRAKGKRVIIGLSDPTYAFRVPHYEILRATLPTLALLKPLGRFDFTQTRDRLRQVANDNGASLFDPRASLCDGDACRHAEAGVSLYVDDNHVAKAKIDLFRNALEAALRQPMP